MRTQYIADDGKVFDDALDCARHELREGGELWENLEAVMLTQHPSVRSNWCLSGACGCVGCVNFALRAAGYCYEHWQVWAERHPEPIPGKFDVVLYGAPMPRIPVIAKMADILGTDLATAKTLLEQLPVTLKHNVDEDVAKDIARRFNGTSAYVSVNPC